jgi:hypothetical protein
MGEAGVKSLKFRKRAVGAMRASHAPQGQATRPRRHRVRRHALLRDALKAHRDHLELCRELRLLFHPMAVVQEKRGRRVQNPEPRSAINSKFLCVKTMLSKPCAFSKRGCSERESSAKRN